MKLSALLVLLGMPLPLCSANTQSCALRIQREDGYSMDGDILIGGTFPITQDSTDRAFSFTEPPQLPTCQGFSISNYVWAQTMVFAIKEINREQRLLPNITLGFHITDTCLSVRRALHGTWRILTGADATIMNYRCQGSTSLAGLVADSSSSRSISVARILGIFRYPQVCYFSSSPVLNDQQQFPSFLRTVPSDDIQALAISQLVVHFGWTWVGLLFTDNDFGEIGSQIVKREFQKSGVCIAYLKIIPVVASALDVGAIVGVVTKSTAKVIIVYANEPYRNPVITALSRQNLTGRVWILVASSSILLRYSIKEVADVLNGALGFELQERWMPGLKELLLRIHPLSSPKDIFAKAFWQEAFGCQWPGLDINSSLSNGNLTNQVLCSGLEDLRTYKNPSFDNPTSRTNYNIYNAVYMVAHALADIASCTPGQGPFINNRCADLRTFAPWQVLHYMKKVRTIKKTGNDMSFDDLYNLINLQLQPHSTAKSVAVGTFDLRAPRGEQFSINSRAILWNTKGMEV